MKAVKKILTATSFVSMYIGRDASDTVTLRFATEDNGDYQYAEASDLRELAQALKKEAKRLEALAA